MRQYHPPPCYGPLVYPPLYADDVRLMHPDLFTGLLLTLLLNGL